jgi:ribosome-binding ATPase YchF (GTP1/OBG family)
VNGKRNVPLQFLDVAGLVPGASKGEGLGNQFLNDLTAATCLVHVVDVSGTTDEAGKVTVGYDPINDIDWLRFEIHSWIFTNLYSKWPNIVKRHVATKSSITDTLQAQLGGYGTSRMLTNQVLDKFNNKDPLESWQEETVRSFVDTFLDVRFPTIIALNKIDLPDSDKNIDRISRKYEKEKIVLISALAENFLRKLHKDRFINYEEGSEYFELAEDSTDPEMKLKVLDAKTRARLEKVQDLVLFRFGHTGVQECLQTVVSLLGLVPVFPVKNVNNFSSSSGTRNGGVFRDCFFVRPNTTMRQIAHMVHPEFDKHYLYAETVGNVRLAEDVLAISAPKPLVISFKTSKA